MGTSVNIVPINDQTYTNVSNGNLHCTVFLRNTQSVKMVVADIEPAPDAPHIPIAYGAANAFGVENLEAADDLWIMNDAGLDEVTVIRGAAQFRMLKE